MIDKSRFGDFVDRIYHIEVGIKDTTDTDRSASYLDLHLEIDLVDRYGISVSQMTCDMFLVLSAFMTYHRVCN